MLKTNYVLTPRLIVKMEKRERERREREREERKQEIRVKEKRKKNYKQYFFQVILSCQ